MPMRTVHVHLQLVDIAVDVDVDNLARYVDRYLNRLIMIIIALVKYTRLQLRMHARRCIHIAGTQF